MVMYYKAIDNKCNIQAIFLYSKLFRIKFLVKSERITLVCSFILNDLTCRLVELIKYKKVKQLKF